MEVLLTEVISGFLPVRTGFYSPSIGILSLAAYLEKSGFKIKVIEPWGLKLDWGKMAALIKSESPDAVGITSLTCTAYHAMALARLIKERSPRTIIIAGGYHFSFLPEESLKICKAIDYIVIGEGEITAFELLDNLRRGRDKEQMKEVRGLAFLIDKDFIMTPARQLIKDLDELPFPAYHLLPSLGKNKSVLLRRRSAGCMFSRGCDKGCKFCSEASLWQARVRNRSARKIADELELLVKKYDISEFSIQDLDFLHNRQRNIDFLNELDKRKLKIKFRIGSRADTIIENKDLLKDFQRLGLISLVVGAENFQQKILDTWNKGITVEQIESALSYIKKAKIPVLECLMVIDSRENKMTCIWHHLKNIDKINMLWTVIITPFPGTVLYKETLAANKIMIWDYRRYDTFHNVISGTNNSLRTLELSTTIINILGFYNPIRILKNLSKGESLRFQLLQLMFDFYLFKRFLFLGLRKLFRLPDRNKEYALTIDEFHNRHLRYINKEKEEYKSIRIWHI